MGLLGHQLLSIPHPFSLNHGNGRIVGWYWWVLALGFVQIVVAAGCRNNETITITSQSDADSYATCSTIFGDLHISSQAQGQMTLRGIETITGSLTCQDAADLVSINAPNLTSITGDFVMLRLDALSGLRFNKLESVRAINWDSLGSLNQLEFSTGISTAQSVRISNTALTSLDGLSLRSVVNLEVHYNPSLLTVNLPLSEYLPGSLEVRDNGDRLSLNLSSLESLGGEMLLHNIYEIYIPSLKTTFAALNLIRNRFSSFHAPNLINTTGLTFSYNNALTDLSLPALTHVDGYLVLQNNSLREVNFTSLETVSQNLNIYGQLDTISLPRLRTCSAGVTIDTRSAYDCNSFHQPDPPLSLTCRSDMNSFNYSSPTDNQNTEGLSSGAKTGLGVGLGVGLPAAIALSALIFLRYRRRAPGTTAEPVVEDHTPPAILCEAEAEEVATAAKPYEMPGPDRDLAVELDSRMLRELEDTHS